MAETIVKLLIGIFILALGISWGLLIWQINRTEMPGLEDLDV